MSNYQKMTFICLYLFTEMAIYLMKNCYILHEIGYIIYEIVYIIYEIGCLILYIMF